MREYPRQYDVAEGLIYDSFLGDSDEVMFSYFIEGIEKLFRAELGDFKYAAIKGSAKYFRYLEQHAASQNMRFEITGFDIPGRKEIPGRGILKFEDNGLKLRTPLMGYYRLDPGGPNEVIIQFSGTDIRQGELNVYAAYKDMRALDTLLCSLRLLHRTERRSRKVVITSAEHEIKLHPLAWDDIILPEATILDIRLYLESFLNNAGLFSSKGISYKRGVLFAGAPGNGKTMLCKVIACQSGLPFILHTISADPYDSDIDEAFELAQELSPAIICFEDLDLISNSPAALGHLLNKLDGIEAHEGLLVLATTNKPELIDPALRNRPSRFDRVYRIMLPDVSCRARMIRKYFNNSFSVEELEEIVELTEGFSMAYLKELYIYATMLSIDKGEETVSATAALQAVNTLREQMTSSNLPVENEARREMGFSSGFHRHRKRGDRW